MLSSSLVIAVLMEHMTSCTALSTYVACVYDNRFLSRDPEGKVQGVMDDPHCFEAKMCNSKVFSLTLSGCKECIVLFTTKIALNNYLKLPCRAQKLF